MSPASNRCSRGVQLKLFEERHAHASRLFAPDRCSHRGSMEALVRNKANRCLPSCFGLCCVARCSARRRIDATSRGWSSTPRKPCPSQASIGNCWSSTERYGREGSYRYLSCVLRSLHTLAFRASKKCLRCTARLDLRDMMVALQMHTLFLSVSVQG